MPLPSRRSFLLLIAAVAASVVLVPLFPDRLLETLHPWLERVASDRLDARVTWEKLSLRPGRLTVLDLRLERYGEVRAAVPRLEADWTATGLLARRLEAVRVEEPSVELILPGKGAPLPVRPPFNVGRLAVVSGRIEVEAAGRTFLLREVAAFGALGVRSPFRLDLRLGAGDGLPLHLAGDFTWGEVPALTLAKATWDGRPLLSAPLTAHLSAAGASAEGALRLDRFDTAQLNTLLAAFQIDPPWPGRWSFVLSTPEVRFGLLEGGWRLRLRVPAAAVANGEMTFPLEGVEADLHQQEGGWETTAGFRLAGAPGRLRARLAGEHAEGSLSLAVIDPGEAKRQIVGGDFPPLAGGVDVEATFSRDGENGGLRLRAKLRGRTGRRQPDYLLDIAPLTADLEVGRPVGGEVAVRSTVRLEGQEVFRLQGKGGRLEAELLPAAGRELAVILPPLPPTSLAREIEGLSGRGVLVHLPSGAWEGEGELAAATVPFPGGVLRQLTARGKGVWEGEEIRLSLATLALEDLEYFTADGSSGLAGGRLQASGSLAGRPEGELRLELTADLGIREALYDAFYADLSSLPARLSLRGRLQPREGRLAAEALTVAAPGLGELSLRGTLTAAAADLAGTLHLPDLRQAFAGSLGEALASLEPNLAGLRPAGALAAEFSGRRAERKWGGAGELRLTGVAIDWPEAKMAVRGVGGSLPFVLATGDEKPDARRRGELAIDELRLGPALLTNRTVLLSAAPGRFAVEAPLSFLLAGGELQIGEAALAFADPPEMSATVRLREVDLGELTRALALPAMAGRASAGLGRIRYRGGTLAADGALGINAFGGDILVRNLRLESLFSPYRTVHADVDFTGIDLNQLTRTLDFGEINGIADGHVHGLRLFGAVPSTFEARLETREEGERNISVKALNNLTVISQGGVASVLTRGIYRFIDFYRYRKIGVRCSLLNDIFTLQGTARPGSENYLVYGGLLPPKIDIVAPVHRISFKEMMRRLQRIERTGDVDSGGPRG